MPTVPTVHKVSIDGGKCQGHARCVDLAPDYFDTDDAGVGLVLRSDVDPDDLADVKKAVLACPEGAITLSE